VLPRRPARRGTGRRRSTGPPPQGPAGRAGAARLRLQDG